VCCEVVAVGTELLLGQIVDTNSNWIGERLSLAGIDSHFQTKVGDNLERIISVVRVALARSDAVIMCGGLGPTHDDITREAIAAVMDVPLVRDEAIAERIRGLFHARGRSMPAINLRQADVPKGARVIGQMPGTAPGLVCPVGEKVIYAVPGVPFEMREMIDGTVLPDLKRRAGAESIIGSLVLRTWGWSESRLAETLAARISELDDVGNPTIAFLASGMEGLKVRITAKAPDIASVRDLLHREETEIHGLLGNIVFGVDDDTMESVVLDLLSQRGMTLAVAETVTGGLVAARLSAQSGADGVLRGSVVFGAAELRFGTLDLAEGAVSPQEAAKAMALGIRKIMVADVGLAAVASEEDENTEKSTTGTVYLAVAIGDDVTAQCVHLPGDRERIQQFAVIGLLNMLRLTLEGRGA
jgi:nicotinamide-nucleotide amidase